jgi:deoxyribonuclease V
VDETYGQPTPAEARALQTRLRGELVTEGEPQNVRLVAGTDVAAGRVGTLGRAAVVVIAYPSLEPVEVATFEDELRFPYVPGLLSFRELPLLLPAFARLRSVPDLVVVDGQGYAHPRRFGLASHLGLTLGLPTIGCAKSRLVGRSEPLPAKRGARAPLIDHGERIGEVVRSRDGVAPLYVSVGHRIALDAAVSWILALTRGLRLPEPTRLAHNAAAGVDVVAAASRVRRKQA